MPTRPTSIPPIALLLAVAGFGAALRVGGLFGTGGPLGAPTGYDDGVYFSASALFTRGLLPYRDFVFVHPPGILYALGIVSWWPDPATGFSMARVLASVCGGVNTLLVGLLVRRSAGAFPGVAAALLYAMYPDALVAEQSTFIEPVLNLLVLGSAMLWLTGLDAPTRRRAFGAGLLCGAACVAKLWGGIWIVAALAAVRERRALPAAAAFIGGALVAGAMLLAPLALPVFDRFLEQTLAFQFMRPPDGTSGWGSRLLELADSDHRSATLFAVIALGSIVVSVARGRLPAVGRAERMFAVATLLTGLGLLVAPTYWRHYNAHLAASQCVLAGFGVAALLRMVPGPRAAAPAAVGLVVLLLDVGSLPRALQHSRARSPEMLVARDTLPRLAPPEGSVFVFDPAWGLAAGRLPAFADNAPVVADSYAVMLLEAVKTGGAFGDTDSAFESSGPQETIRARLLASDAVMLGWRGTWQLNEQDGAWFARLFECRNPEAGDLCVWTRRPAPLTGEQRLEDQFLQFGEGWYDREGVPPLTWRWMGERAVIHLPARRGTMRLDLSLDVPLEDIDGAPTIEMALEGRVLDRFQAVSPRVNRSIEVQVDGTSPHALMLSSDRSFSPTARSTSSDTRILALKLTSVTWTRAGAAGVDDGVAGQSRVGQAPLDGAP